MSDYPLVYRKQGATELVIQSSGLLSVDGSMDLSGDLDIESGGGIDVQSGADITVEAGGYIATPSSQETAATTAKNYGISTFDGSSSGLYYINAPVAGVEKTLYTTGLTTGKEVIVDGGSTAILFINPPSTATTSIGCRSTESTGSPQVAYLRGLDTVSYLVVAKTSGWVLI